VTWVGTGESIWWRGRNLKIWIDCTGGESTESERVDPRSRDFDSQSISNSLLSQWWGICVLIQDN
jgi:hypothetical protein